MNELVIIIAGSLCIALAVGLIVGGARSHAGAASSRVYAIIGGFLLLCLALMLMTFGLPRVTIPYLLPSSIVGALILGWVAGMMWGSHSKHINH